jgi:hypothetical protein
LAINLNNPGTFLHWSFIDISVANLIVIVTMMIIFGLALLIRFPHSGRVLPAEPDADDATVTAAAAAAPGDAGMWTAKARTKIASVLPPKKLLPDRQPAYVASWVYVFGVASLAALGIVIASGLALALGGSDWWHTNVVGHYFNSLHLWSTELFMAFLVIHLWGKFWMAAWRGRRAMTWITGMVAFLASIIEAFTGYLSQQNYDAQWIATNGKDAFNAVGVGAWFNALNFGQMLMWHIVLVPLVLVALVGAHILLVRVRGISHPLPEKRSSVRGRAARRAAAAADAGPWRGPTRRYDILKEGTIATVVVGALVVVMASIMSSPDVPPITVQSWSKVVPADFLGTAATELDGTGGAAAYGPPYNNGTDGVQQVGPINFQKLSGITEPVNGAQTFVLTPLSRIAPTAPSLAAALARYNGATPAQQQKWAAAYDAALTGGKVPFNNGNLSVPAAGPVPVMMSYELTMARSGALDANLLAQHPFFGTDYTKPLLFIADGGYYADRATALHLTGDQWGVMNETGSYPGQPWLWLFQLWYHVPPFSTSLGANVDIWAVYLTGIGTLLLLLIPFIPGLRDIPRLIPVNRLIWRSWYRSADGSASSPSKPEPAGQAKP